MTAAEILAELEARNIEVAAVGGKLRLEAPPGAMAPWLQAALVEHRAELLASLEAETGATGTTTAALPDSGAGDTPASPPLPAPASSPPPLPAGPEGALHIPLDELVYGDFLARHRLRIVGGTAYPDGRTFRPTIYLADDTG